MAHKLLAHRVDALTLSSGARLEHREAWVLAVQLARRLLVLLDVDAVPHKVQRLGKVHSLGDRQPIADVALVHVQHALHYCFFCNLITLLPAQVFVEHDFQLVLLVEADVQGRSPDGTHVMEHGLEPCQRLVEQVVQMVVGDVANVAQPYFHELAEQPQREVAECIRQLIVLCKLLQVQQPR